MPPMPPEVTVPVAPASIVTFVDTVLLEFSRPPKTIFPPSESNVTPAGDEFATIVSPSIVMSPPLVLMFGELTVLKPSPELSVSADSVTFSLAVLPFCVASISALLFIVIWRAACKVKVASPAIAPVTMSLVTLMSPGSALLPELPNEALSAVVVTVTFVPASSAVTILPAAVASIT
ncbi:MAG: hypothetical protein MRJ96_07900 [Nitrospirales bacterium]|nr:hypothetical protein [Nitrospirales bacterium]